MLDSIYYDFVSDLYKSDNTELSFKICNESDVPAVTP